MDPDFPAWLRTTHLLNFVLIGMLLRSGWEILASLPRLWWSNDSAPGKEWLKFTRRELPREEGVYTSLMDERSAHPVFTLPGKKHIGLGRHWHGLSATLLVVVYLVYVLLRYGTVLWRSIVSTSPLLVPDSRDSLLVYLSCQAPGTAHSRTYHALHVPGCTSDISLLTSSLEPTG